MTPLQPHDCQLMVLEDLGAEPPVWYLRRRTRNAFRRLRRLAIRLLGRRPNEMEKAELPKDSGASDALMLSPGDRVRVRSREEIEKTLGPDHLCCGCAFLEPMARYCGREFRVVQRVDRFFDERRWRMLKCRGIVFLENVYCEGSGHPDTRGCQRMCFFFWRTEWLERIN